MRYHYWCLLGILFIVVLLVMQCRKSYEMLDSPLNMTYQKVIHDANTVPNMTLTVKSADGKSGTMTLNYSQLSHGWNISNMTKDNGNIALFGNDETAGCSQMSVLLDSDTSTARVSIMSQVLNQSVDPISFLSNPQCNGS